MTKDPSRIPHQHSTTLWNEIITASVLADRTATQYDRLLASSYRPSVRLSVCI